MVAGVANAKKAFRVVQIGKESVYGTEVNGTRKLRILGLTWAESGQQRQYIPDYSIGRMTRNTDTGTVTRTGLTGGLETDFSFEDVLFFLLAGFKGGVAASAEKTVGQADYEWVFQLDPNTGDPTPDSYTMERRLSDGTTNWDRTAPGLIIRQFEISATQDGDVTKLSGEFWTRAPNGNAIAAGLSLPAVFTRLPALSWKFFVNDTWSAMDILGAAPSYGGGTQLSTTVKSFTFRYLSGLEPALYIGDGRTDPSKHSFLPRGAELELNVEFNANIATELTQAGNAAKRYIRLLGEGARIGTGYNKTVLLQGAFIYPDGGFGEVGRDENGTETVTLRLESVPDDDTEDVEVRIINTINAFP